ncbi:caspase, EACC1-associated type [Streptomyces sp. HC307]|uniref:caspase, EACC1-associated type n=1 Tax=Streptomyces flavusporus TaxID=3385496 RepID=UPI003916E2BA
MTGHLATSGACAVLIGTGRHVPGSKLSDLPAVDATLDDLQKALHEVCGMAPERVTRVPAGADPAEVVAAVEEAAAQAAGPLLLYYVGHGLLGPGDELYLATRSSSSARNIAHAVPYRTLRDLLGEVGGGSLVVLDCCFSGRGKVPRSDGGMRQPFVSALPRGSFLLSSASNFELSFAPEGERHTLFSGRLLRLLTEGDPAGPPWLTADRLHTALDREFADDTRVRPARQSEGTLGGLVIARNRAYRVPDGDAVEPPADVPCPYPGLAPFRAEDSGHFFGRDDLVEQLLTAVARPGSEPGEPVVVVGASGAGKSSLLRAGLLASLERRHAADGSEDLWPALLLPTPGAHPMDALSEAWAEATGRETHEVRTALEAGRFPPPRAGREPCRLLVVDQFEELFTHCQDTGERDAFVAVLTADAGAARPRVVLGLRADHYGSCLAHPELESALEHGQVNVPPMRERDLRAAVEEPAAAVGLGLERGLTDRLLHDLNEGRLGDDETGALPFLAHALRETWRERSGTRLTLTGYQVTGGIWQSVAKTGEALHESLDDDGRGALRDLLLRMVHLPPDGTGARAGIRRPVPLGSLLDGLPPGARKIRDRLAEDRLITVGQDTAQIAHEALLRAWPRLHDWIEEDAVTLLRRQQLRTAADDWRAADRDAAFLLTGSRLHAALELRDPGGHGPLPERESEFLAASEEAAESARRRERRRVTVLKTAVVALVIGLVVAIGSAVVAIRQEEKAQEQRRSAQKQRELATYRALLAEAQNLRGTDPRTSLDLGLAAHALRPTGESRRVISETLRESPFRSSTVLKTHVSTTVLGPDGRTLAAVDSEDGMTLWDVGRGSARRTPLARLNCRPSSAADVSFGGPGGRILAARCTEDTLSLWDLTGLHTGTEPRRLNTLHVDGLPGSPDALALNADGTRLAATGWWSEDEDVAAEEGAALVLWDVSEPRRPRRLSVTKGVYEVDRVAFSPDGRTLATSADMVRTRGPLDVGNAYVTSGVRTWDVSDPRRPRRGDKVIGSEGDVAFSPDGKSLVTIDDRSARLIDVTEPTDPEELAEWPVHSAEVQGFTFSRDSRRLATAGEDGVVAVWDLTDPRAPERRDSLIGHRSVSGKLDRGVDINALGFGADDRTLVSVSTYGDESEVIHWSLGSAQKAHVVGKVDGGGGSTRMALTPDGKTLAVSGATETSLWDVSERTRPKAKATLRDTYSVINDIALNADGTLLASAHINGTVVLWDVSDRTRPRIAGRFTTEKWNGIALAFSPDAPLLAVHGEDLGLWNIADPARPTRTAHFPEPHPYADVSFSPDGSRLLTSPGDVSRGVSLWDLSAGDKGFVMLPDPRHPRVGLNGDTAFSPNGTLVAIADPTMYGFEEAALVLFDVSDPRHPRHMSSVGREDEKKVGFNRVAFNPDGNLVAAAGEDGITWLWSVADPTKAHLAGRLGEHPDTVDDVLFGPDGQTLVTSSDGIAYLWDLGDYPEIAADTIGMACRVASGGLLDWEWQVYAPDVPFHTSCPSG